MVPSDQTKSNDDKLCSRRFRLDLRKSFFTRRDSPRPGHQRRGASSRLDGFKAWIDQAAAAPPSIDDSPTPSWRLAWTPPETTSSQHFYDKQTQ